jgi:hypothetical protein
LLLGKASAAKNFLAANKATQSVDNVVQQTGKTLTKTGNCFVAGTEVLTLEGEKNIEEIEVGDWVVADDPNTVGEIEYKQVTETFVRHTDKLVDLYIDGEVISTTGEHPFWTPDKGWVEAKDLEVGSLLQTEDGRIIDVDGVEKREGDFTVYNFRVEGFHTYFVSELGVLVHNAAYQTRINLAQGQTRSTPLRPSTGNPVSAGWEHVLNDHFNRGIGNNRSVFTIQPDELKSILQSQPVVQSPARSLGDGHYESIVDVGQNVGISSLKDGGQPTSIIKILSDVKGNLITAYPVGN